MFRARCRFRCRRLSAARGPLRRPHPDSAWSGVYYVDPELSGPRLAGWSSDHARAWRPDCATSIRRAFPVHASGITCGIPKLAVPLGSSIPGQTPRVPISFNAAPSVAIPLHFSLPQRNSSCAFASYPVNLSCDSLDVPGAVREFRARRGPQSPRPGGSEVTEMRARMSRCGNGRDSKSSKGPSCN